MDLLQEIDKNMEKINKIHPFQGAYLQQINQFFKVETTYSSNAVEGNTHTLEETKVILEDGITIGGRSLKEFYEVEGHGKAYDYMFSLINKKELTEADILYCHELFSKNIPDFISCGEYRKVEVLISGSKKILPKAENVSFAFFAVNKFFRTNLFKIDFPTLVIDRQRPFTVYYPKLNKGVHPLCGGVDPCARRMNAFLCTKWE